MNRAIAARAALYNADSARVLGWSTASRGAYSSPADPALPYLVSRFQEKNGMTADGRVTPDTLRAMIQIAKITRYGTDRLLDSLLLGNANPDAGTPQIPDEQAADAAAPTSSLPRWLLPAVAVAAAWYYLGRRR
jgi:hypothetical protein